MVGRTGNKAKLYNHIVLLLFFTIVLFLYFSILIPPIYTVIFDRSHYCGGDPEKKRIFCLVHAAKLSYQVCDEALRERDIITQGCPGTLM